MAIIVTFAVWVASFAYTQSHATSMEKPDHAPPPAAVAEQRQEVPEAPVAAEKPNELKQPTAKELPKNIEDPKDGEKMIPQEEPPWEDQFHIV